MPQNGYSVGRDTTVVFIKPDGAVLRFGKVTTFESKPASSNTATVKGIDGVTDHIPFRDGDWSFSFKAERRHADVDIYFAQLEANYRAGVSEGYGTLVQTISEPDGTVSQWRYDRSILDYEDAGSWAADKTVSQSVKGMAGSRIQDA